MDSLETKLTGDTVSAIEEIMGVDAMRHRGDTAISSMPLESQDRDRDRGARSMPGSPVPLGLSAIRKGGGGGSGGGGDLTKHPPTPPFRVISPNANSSMPSVWNPEDSLTEMIYGTPAERHVALSRSQPAPTARHISSIGSGTRGSSGIGSASASGGGGWSLKGHITYGAVSATGSLGASLIGVVADLKSSDIPPLTRPVNAYVSPNARNYYPTRTQLASQGKRVRPAVQCGPRAMVNHEASLMAIMRSSKVAPRPRTAPTIEGRELRLRNSRPF